MQRLVPATTLVLLVDVQEKLAAAMPEDARARVVKHAGILLEAARVLGAPVVVSEQYPKGLGPTVPELRTKLDALGVTPFAKTTFDACGDLAIARAVADAGASAVVVMGMEAHVCVMQTVRELVNRRFDTYVVADAVSSRREADRAVGLGLAERAGASVTTTETVVFDWMERAGTDAFKAISPLLR